MSDLIDRQVAIDELQKEINKGIPPFDDVMGVIRCGVRLARNIIEDLPSAQPEYEPVTAVGFAKTMSENEFYSFIYWHGWALALMKEHGLVICKKTM